MQRKSAAMQHFLVVKCLHDQRKPTDSNALGFWNPGICVKSDLRWYETLNSSKVFTQM